MPIHRFREQLRSGSSAEATAAYLPCPLFAQMSAAQQAVIAEVYRVAAEQLRSRERPSPDRQRHFSAN